MPNKYEASIEWLFSRFPSYQHLGAQAYKPGLANTEAILAAVGNPEKKLSFIHIAGTNGKGSTCAFIASILQQKGFKVGLFTSPHLVDFRERIRINGKPISEEHVVQFCDQVQSLTLALSFFEITLAMALVHFKREHCDYVVLETGMGGRLDATNVVTPILTIITTIGLDHQAFLGNTLEAIATEKAGIIKSGVPIICGEERESLIHIFTQRADALNAPFYCAEHFIDDPKHVLPTYQLKNANLALTALKHIGVNPISVDIQWIWEHLFETTGFIGRLFPSNVHTKLWYDVSHNEDGLKTTFQAITSMGIHSPIVIFGASNDKTLNHLSDIDSTIDRWIFCEFSNPRSYTSHELTSAINQLPLKKTSVLSNVNDAIALALNERATEQAILVTGSFFLLSDCEEIQTILRGQLTQ